jgi:hypothetical protein
MRLVDSTPAQAQARSAARAGVHTALWCALAWLACAAHASTAGAPAVATTSASAPAAGVALQPLPPLPAGQRLAHRAVRGSLGPWAAVDVWLTQPQQPADGPFTPWVRTPADGAAAAPGQVYALSTPSEPGDFFQFQVRSVMFRSVDGSAERALIVLYTVARIGPQQAPEAAACVYRWAQGEFVRDSAAEALLKGARNAADVATRLAAHKPTP